MISRRALLAAAALWPAGEEFADAAVPAGWPGALLMATGRPGGAYDVYGPAWGRFAQALSGVEIAYRASGGAAADILLIEQGAAQLGMTTVMVAVQAQGGTGAWTAGVKLTGFRALFPMFPSVMQIVTLGNNRITAIAALADGVIGVGPDGGSGAACVPAALAALGILPKQVVTGDFARQMRDLLAGNLTACAFIGAPPVPAISAAARTARLGLLGFTPAEVATVSAVVPGLAGMAIPAGSFPGQTMTISSLGTGNFAIGAAGLPDGLVGAITLAGMRNQAALARLVPAAETPPRAMMAAADGLAFHPGAAQALRGLGLDVR